jgi:signal transduction histidine kinase
MDAPDRRAPVGERSQRGRVLGSILLAALPLLALTLTVLAGQLREGEARIRRGREALALSVASTTGALATDQIAVLQGLALTEDVTNPTYHTTLGALFKDIAEASAVLDTVTLWDAEGRSLATATDGQGSSPVSGGGAAARHDFRPVLVTGRPHASAASTPRTTTTARESPTIYLSVPVALADGRRAVLGGTLDLDQVERQLRASLTEQAIDLRLVDGAGKVFLPRTAYRPTSLPPTGHDRPDIATALAGKAGSNAVDVPGRGTLLVAHAPIAGTRWTVLVQQPLAEAFAVERRNTVVNAAFLGVATLTSVGIGWIVSRRFDLIYRGLAAARAQADAARVAAEQAVAQRDALLAMVAHELRNPLTAVKGQVQLMGRRLARGDAVDPTRITTTVATIETIVGSMTGMLNELLDAASLRSSRALTLNLTQVDVVALVREAVQTQAATAERHRLRVDTDLAALIGTLDGPRLQRVVDNLLANAVNYSPAGTEIRVGVSRQTRPDGDWAVITVHDAGVGIPAGDLPRIFEPFYRGANVADRAGGVGLGLSGSRQIVDQHGGTLTAESDEGAGSTFTVRLPLVPSDGSPARR